MHPAPFDGVFDGRRVLITGHTGFKGSWISKWLLELKAHVTGYALEPDTEPSLFTELALSQFVDSRIGDVRDAQALAALVAEIKPEIVLHLAAQPLVRRSYHEPTETFAINVMGTANLLDACRSSSSVRAIVNVTTDKVYSNPENGIPFTEGDPLGGHDPYSASKAASEIVTASYRASYFLGPQTASVATARAGNVIGGGDWAEDRLVPDCARALASGEAVAIRNSASVRPWQHVLEPLSGYLQLASLLWREGDRFASAYNFGPNPEGARTVAEVADLFVSSWGGGSWHTVENGVQPHEAGHLTLDTNKAMHELGWSPAWSFEETVKKTALWYRDRAMGMPSTELVERDLQAFTISNGTFAAIGRDGANS